MKLMAVQKNRFGDTSLSNEEFSGSCYRVLDYNLIAVQRDCNPYLWINAVRSRLNGQDPVTVIFERPLKIELDLVDHEFYYRNRHWNHGLALHPKLVDDLCAFWDEYKEDHLNTAVSGGASKWWRDNWQQRNCVLTVY